MLPGIGDTLIHKRVVDRAFTMRCWSTILLDGEMQGTYVVSRERSVSLCVIDCIQCPEEGVAA